MFTSDGILNLQCFPERLVIIGAGIIGCEYATIFSNFRQTIVYLIDHANRVIPYEDEDVSDFVHDNLTQNGVKVIHSAKLRKILNNPNYLQVVLDFKDGHSEVIEAAAAFISIGRYAVKHMFGKKRWPLNYDNMSTVMFFHPPVAAVGLNEKECRRKSIPYKVAYYSNALCNRANRYEGYSWFC